ncbi:MAG: Serine/threonine-protein kinase PknD [Phycisphaerae bacterium]|nr:Serine/threonine-protein kinase PknD [Phycisphaerae bacterium]
MSSAPQPQDSISTDRDAALIAGVRRQIEQVVSRRSDEPGPSAAHAIAPASILPGGDIGGYEIVRELHRGGQGVVYLAVQRATKRDVALKMVAAGPFLGGAERARFQREIEVLAALRHPNIVTIHDSGDAYGCVYFAMDYIAGVSFGEHMEQRRTRALQGGSNAWRQFVWEAVALFAQIADAVNAAHQRGFIHRDLKPGNIRIDESGRPHVLDFGLAKLAQEPRGGSSAADPLTLTGQFVGTLPYASPEQAAGDASAVDIRTDVYALGVMLYEAVTGRLPHDPRGTWREVVARIVEEPPARPGAAARRFAAGSHARPIIPGDLERVILTALQKSPERRYQSAGEFAEDLRRCHEGRPIAARADSPAYILRMLLRRYRVAVGTAAAVFVLLTAAALTLAQLYRQTLHLLAQVKQERDRAAEARALADRRGELYRAVADFQMAMLSAADPLRTGQRDVSVREVMERGVARLDAGETRGKPEVEAALRTTIGRTFRGLGLYQRAESQLRVALELYERVFASESFELAACLTELASCLTDAGQNPEAETLARRALEIHADEQPAAGDATPDAGDERNQNDALSVLATILHKRGAVQEAQDLMVEVLAERRTRLGVNHPAVAGVLVNLAETLRVRGQLKDAERAAREALAIRKAHFGDEHVAVARSLNALGMVLQSQERAGEAAEAYREALRIEERVLEPTHPLLGSTRGNLAASLLATGDLPAARQAIEALLETEARILPEYDRRVIANWGNLGVVRVELGDLEGGEAAQRQALRGARAAFPGDHPTLANAIGNLGGTLLLKGEYAEAEQHLQDAIDMLTRLYGAANARVISDKLRLCKLLVLTERLEEMEVLLDECVLAAAGLSEVPRPLRGALNLAIAALAERLEQCGRTDDAQAWRLRVIDSDRP